MNFETDDVKEFIQSLKDPEFLLEGCRRFCQNEKREFAVTYAVALDYAEREQEHIPRLALAAETLLLSWNKSYYDTRRGLVPQVNADLAEAITARWNDILTLRKTELGELGQEDLRLASSLFKCMADIDSISVTGATKALHVICPDVFVIWDTEIRNAYHVFHEAHSDIHGVGDELCYKTFLIAFNEVASALLPKRHYLIMNYLNIQKLGRRKSLAKMIDEANYAKFKQGESW